MPIAIWLVCALVLLGILLRPRGIPEWIWAVSGAVVLVVAGLLSLGAAAQAVRSGLDVYLFLAGMLALAALARVQGVFDWIAARVVPAAGASSSKLFTWTYAVGVGVTALLSNDATVLLLTPAVIAAVRRACVDPLPYVYACVFVASAASFVLPMSNPANLLLFHPLPRLAAWFAAFALSSLASVGVTYALLYAMQMRNLSPPRADAGISPSLSPTGRLTAVVVAGAALALVAVSAIGWPVGQGAFALGAAALLVVTLFDSGSARAVLRSAPWSIIPLVAGLFVIVAAMDRTGSLQAARGFFHYASALPAPASSLLAGAAVTLGDNLFNNLPTAVAARFALHHAHLAPQVAHAALVGLDLGPNLSITGSLATIIWLTILRRENILVSARQFLRMGIVVTLPALLVALLVVR